MSGNGRYTPEKGSYTPEKGGYSHYVVWKGRNPGIYTSWNECHDQVSEFSEAAFKGFRSFEDAEAAFNPSLCISSHKCQNCKILSMKNKILETQLAYYTEKQQDTSSNNKSVPDLFGELSEMLEEKARLDH